MAQDTLEPQKNDGLDDSLNPAHHSLRTAEEKATQRGTDAASEDIDNNYGDETERPLGDRETAAAGGGVGSGGGTSGKNTGSTSGGDDDSVNYTGGASSKSGFRGKLQGLSRGRKFMLMAFATGGGGLIAVIVLIFLLASSLDIPNLAQNIEAYQFARLTRQTAKNINRVTQEKLASDALESKTWSQTVKDRYQNLRGNTWGKFDKFRPDQVMKNLQSENGFKLTYKDTGAFGQSRQLVGVTLDNETHLALTNTSRTRFVPLLSSYIDFKNNVSLASRLEPALDAAMRANDIGPIVRGSVAKDVRQRLGIGLVAWKLGKFQGKDAKAARLEEARQKAANIENKPIADNASSADTQKAVDDAKNAEKDVLSDDKKLQQTIDNNGDAPSIRKAIGDTLTKSGIADTVAFFNTAYSVAVPLCIVYDSSIEHSGPTIDNQTKQQMAAYQYVASGADQLKTGSQNTDPSTATELGLAAGAMTDDLGDTNQSNALKRAYGQQPDTSGYISSEAGAGGEYTLLNAAGVPSILADGLNDFGDTLCPALTDLRVAGITAVVGLGVNFFTGGAFTGAGKAADEVVIKPAEQNIVRRLITKTATGAVKTKQIVTDGVKSTAKVVGLSVLAKLVVSARAGQQNGGLTQGVPLADEADSGGNILAGEYDRAGQYGRPLTTPEIGQSDSADRKTVAEENSSRSVFERYIATNNSFSLLSRIAMSVQGNSNNSFVRTLVNMTASLLRPMTSIGSLANTFTHSAQAAVSPVDLHYGNIQFGWSESEEALIDSNTSYSSHLENQLQLDQSGQEDEIEGKYGKCFTESLGDLIKSGDVQRDADGNVLSDQGLCAPDNLGPNNPKYGDMVFRWRLAKSYDNTVDNLTAAQSVTSDQPAGDSGAAQGDAVSLAQQVLANSNITLSASSKADLQATVQGQAIMPGPVGDGSSGLPGCTSRVPTAINPELLEVMLNIGQKYKYEINNVVSGHDCDTGQHPQGRAMDIFQIDGKALDDSWWASSANVSVIDDIGNIVHNSATSEFGFGVGNTAVSKIQSRGNLNVFCDSGCTAGTHQDEIHIDVRGAP